MLRLLQPLLQNSRIRSKVASAAMTTSALSTPIPLKGSFSAEIPTLIYGTAWKKERTADLVYEALKAGFKGIDTAAQPRHYKEDLVGDGIRRAVSEGVVKREDIFVQTKYTPPGGQSPESMPYSASLSIPEQVHASVASSLRNLGTSESAYLDCVLMHSPLPKLGGTVLAWNTLSTYVASGKIRHLGIANVTLPVLTILVNDKEVKPAVVQNRFYADTRYEVLMRKFCREHGIVFQSFWTLTGNPGLLRSATVAELAEKAGVTNEVALYALVVGLKWLVVLDGTTNAQRMREDLVGLEKVGKWVEGQGRDEWDRIHQEFKGLIKEIQETVNPNLGKTK